MINERAGIIAIGLAMIAITLGFAGVALGIANRSTDEATIGGTEVPYGLECMEDEVIGFIEVDGLGCVHIEEVR